MRKNIRILIPLLSAVIIAFSILIASSIGVVDITLPNIIKILLHQTGIATPKGISQTEIITIWELRMPRIIMSLLAGAALALCGAVFQSIFRNPICDPYILGISSGASLGATSAFILGWDAYLFGLTLPALISALLTLLIIMGIARLSKQRTTHTLLLTGIALNFLISAIITLLMVINQQEMHKIIFWTMGSCAGSTWNDVLFLLPFLLVLACVLFYYAKDLNIMQLGSDTAHTLGVDIKKATYIPIITSSLLIAVVVAICGVIGFIGLIVPHMVRILIGSDNRHVFRYSLLLGALFLLTADTIARTIAVPSELPVGSITALAGAPYFIFLLLKNNNR